MRRSILAVGLAIALSCPGAGWRARGEEPVQQPVRRSVGLHHVPPSRMVEKLNVLGAMGSDETRNVSFVANDATGTLDFEVPTSAGDAFERRRLAIVLTDAIRKMDVADRDVVQIHVTVVQGDILTDTEFIRLHDALEKGPVGGAPGVSAKGVIFETVIDALPGRVADYGHRQQDKGLPEYYPKVAATGRVLAERLEPEGFEFLMEFHGVLHEPLKGGEQDWNFTTMFSPPFTSPIILVAGEQVPAQGPETSNETQPVRYERMLYLHASLVRNVLDPESAAATAP